MIKQIHDGGVENLRVAIVETACHDYLRAKTKKYFTHKKNEDMDELLRFFRSDWYRELMPKIDGEFLIKQLDKKFEEDIIPELKETGKVSFKRKGAQ